MKNTSNKGPDMKPKPTEFRVQGVLLAVEGDPDMIASGILDGTIDVNSEGGTDGPFEPTPAELMLVPATFSLTCDGINGQFACAEQEDAPQNKADAIAKGWKGLRFTPFEMGANYMGTCPRCQLEDS